MSPPGSWRNRGGGGNGVPTPGPGISRATTEGDASPAQDDRSASPRNRRKSRRRSDAVAARLASEGRLPASARATQFH